MRLVVPVVSFLLACGAKTQLEVEPPPPPDAGIAEECNGVDDDFDGRVDEGIHDRICELGGCTATVAGCVDGEAPACEFPPPRPETCNGEDDDCDGSTDEGLGFGPIGESILVRSETELLTGDCSTCAWASGAIGGSTSDGIFVAFTLGFDGSDIRPNFFGRRLDDDGTPVSDLLPLDLANGGHLRATPHSDGVLLTYCGRFSANDETTRALIGPGGDVRWERRAEPDRSCGAWFPQSVFTGERILTSWTDNSSGPVMGHELLLDVAGADGESRSNRELFPEGDGGPTFASAHGRLLHAATVRPEIRQTQIRVQTLDTRGDALGEPVFVDPPPAMGESWFSRAFAVPSRTGFVVHAAQGIRALGGRFVVAFDRDGVPIGAPRVFDEGYVVNGFDHVFGFEGGAILAGSFGPIGESVYRVLRVDADGEVDAEWLPLEDDPEFSAPFFFTHRGRLFVVYRRSVASRPVSLNQVRIWALGCRE